MKPASALKHLFIPHEGNDYKPHFFRELSIAIVLFASIFLLGFSAGSSFILHRTVLGASVAASVLIDLTNESRLAYNEAPLARSEKLVAAAALKGQDMAKNGYFAHESPTGVTPWHWFKEVGYTFLYAGENLAVNFTESEAVQKAWLDSPKHRENILNAKFTEIGIATVEGMYNNNPTMFVVQMFGTPARLAVAEPVVAPVPEPTPKSLQVKASEPQAGTVQGKATGTDARPEPSTLIPLFTSPELAIVKSADKVTEVPQEPSQAPVEKYSSWADRFIFFGSHYVQLLYIILIIVVGVALMTMILVEIKKQHPKHILYGVLLLLALAIFVYINRGFIY